MIESMLLAAALATTPTPCSSGSEYNPPLCPIDLPGIRTIAIQRNGAAAYPDKSGSASCAGFKLSRAQVARYLSHASSTDRASADATLDRSPCFASGEVSFADGQRAAWKIEQFGVGTIDWPAGRTTLLYCQACTFPPFKR